MVSSRFPQNCEKRLLASSCLSVCQSVHMEQLGSHWTDFHEILYLSIFRKKRYGEKIQVTLISDKNDRYLYCTRRPGNIFDRILDFKLSPFSVCCMVSSG